MQDITLIKILVQKECAQDEVDDWEEEATQIHKAYLISGVCVCVVGAVAALLTAKVIIYGKKRNELFLTLIPILLTISNTDSVVWYAVLLKEEYGSTASFLLGVI